MIYHRPLALLFVAGAALFSEPAFAVDAPSRELLQNQLATELPGFWTINDYDLRASVNLGNEVEPLVRQRSVATIAPAVDLFEIVRVEGAVTFLQRTHLAGQPAPMFLLSSATWRAEQWQVAFERETDPTANNGRPREAFAAPTVVIGTAEEVEHYERLTADADRALQQELNEIGRRSELTAAEIVAADAEAAAEATIKLAQAARGQDAARALLEVLLPPYWTISSFEFRGAVSPSGGAVGTVAATVRLIQDIFTADASLEGISFLSRGLVAGEERQFAGPVAEIPALVGALEDSGRPRAYFLGLTVVRGSDEERAFFATEQQMRSAEHQAGLLAIARSAELAAAQAAAEAERAAERRAAELTALEHERALAGAAAAAAAQEAEVRHAEGLAAIARAADVAEAEASARLQAAERDRVAADAVRAADAARAEAAARAMVESLLPPWWEVTAFAVRGPSDGGPYWVSGGELSPLVGIDATIRVAADTFVADGMLGMVTLLRPAASVGTERRLTGPVAEAAEVGSLGDKPRNAFAGETLLRGSEEAAYVANQTRDREEQQRQLEVAVANIDAVMRSAVSDVAKVGAINMALAFGPLAEQEGLLADLLIQSTLENGTISGLRDGQPQFLTVTGYDPASRVYIASYSSGGYYQDNLIVTVNNRRLIIGRADDDSFNGSYLCDRQTSGSWTCSGSQQRSSNSYENATFYLLVAQSIAPSEADVQAALSALDVLLASEASNATKLAAIGSALDRGPLAGRVELVTNLLIHNTFVHRPTVTGRSGSEPREFVVGAFDMASARYEILYDGRENGDGTVNVMGATFTVQTPAIEAIFDCGIDEGGWWVCTGRGSAGSLSFTLMAP